MRGMFGGWVSIAVVAAIVVINAEFSSAQGYGGEMAFACDILCGSGSGMDSGMDSMDPYYRGFANFFKETCRFKTYVKCMKLKPTPRPGKPGYGCDNYGQSCWGGAGKRKRK